MASNRRKEKLQSLIRREISSYLSKEVNNPHIGFVSIVNVEMNQDLTVARVFVSVLGSAREEKENIEALRSSEKYIQFLLGRNLSLKNTPLVRFILTDALKSGDQMMEKLNHISSHDANS